MPTIPNIFTTQDTLFESLDPAGVYTDYAISNRYEQDGHIYMMSVASPTSISDSTNPVYFVRLGSSTLLWICDWTAARLYSKPRVPNPTPNDTNWVQMDTWTSPYSLIFASDGFTPLYRLSGTYIYGHKNPRQAVFTYGRPPWMQDKLDRIVTADQLQKNLSDTASTIGIGIGGNPPGGIGIINVNK